eukprot:scaffold22345_cov125-Isochrysis_galbana.AAC.3
MALEGELLRRLRTGDGNEAHRVDSSVPRRGVQGRELDGGGAIWQEPAKQPCQCWVQVERLGRHGARDLVGEDVRLVWRPPKAERGAQGEQGDVHAQPVGRERPGVVQAQGLAGGAMRSGLIFERWQTLRMRPRGGAPRWRHRSRSTRWVDSCFGRWCEDGFGAQGMGARLV